MTYVGADFMPLERQLFSRNIADALRDFAQQKYGSAKAVARAWRIDPTTAANLFKGHLSIITMGKAIAVEGRDLWEAIGTEITGETYHQYEERKLRRIIREADHAREKLVRLRTRAAILAEGPQDLDPALAGDLLEQDRNEDRGRRAGTSR